MVGRYIDLVYSTALRQVGGDAHLAQDVAQTVFLHLARKARRSPQGVMLGGWLHQATCNVAANPNRRGRFVIPAAPHHIGWAAGGDSVKQDLGPVINLVPVISGDKSAVEITLQAATNQRAVPAK